MHLSDTALAMLLGNVKKAKAARHAFSKAEKRRARALKREAKRRFQRLPKMSPAALAMRLANIQKQNQTEAARRSALRRFWRTTEQRFTGCGCDIGFTSGLHWVPNDT